MPKVISGKKFTSVKKMVPGGFCRSELERCRAGIRWNSSTLKSFLKVISGSEAALVSEELNTQLEFQKDQGFRLKSRQTREMQRQLPRYSVLDRIRRS